MTKKILVISGSARTNSSSTQLVEHLYGKDVNHIELCKKQISQYDYDGNYAAEDDFQHIANEMLASDLIILATPVYWYTMSGHMKVFMDRWTDLITTHKNKGRAMKGKRIGLIVQATREDMPEAFELPIKLTAEYMEMEYVGGAFWDMRSELTNTESLKTIISNW